MEYSCQINVDMVVDMKDKIYPKLEAWGKMKLLQKIIGLFLLLVSPLYADQINFVGSALWNNIRDLEARGGHIYCAYVEGLQIMNCENPESLKPEGNIFIKGWCNEIAISGKYATLAGCDQGLPVINISSPENPRLISMYTAIGKISSVNYFDDRIYASDSLGALHIFDVKDAEHPQELLKYPVEGKILDVAVRNNIAFLTIGIDEFTGYGGGYLRVLDISDFKNPKPLGDYYTKGCASDIEIKGDYAYLLDGSNGLQILDISNFLNPVLVGQASCSTGDYEGCLQISGNYAYISRSYGGFFCVDISNPAQPVVAADSANIYTPPYRQPRNMRMSIDRNIAYVTGQKPQITVLNLSNPGKPEILGTYGVYEKISDVLVDRQHVFVIDEKLGLVIMDISKSGKIEVISQYPVNGEVSGFTVSGNLAIMILNEQSGWKSKNTAIFIDLADLKNPKHICNFDFETDREIENVRIFQNYAFFAGRFPGIIILDISKPDNPVQISYLPTTEFVNGIQIFAERMYLACNFAGMQIYDFKEPAKPVLMGSYDTQYANAVVISGNYGFIADGVDGLVIVDISQPDDIRQISNYIIKDEEGKKASLQFDDVIIADNTLFLCGNSAGEFRKKIFAFNISDKSNPVITAEYGPIEFGEKFAFWNNLIFVPDWNFLLVLNFSR
jgi:hypothetical protein